MTKQIPARRQTKVPRSRKRPVTKHWWALHHTLLAASCFAIATLISLAQIPPIVSFAGGVTADYFAYPDGLVTNEYAYWNSGESGIRSSSIWNMTSGSLFAQNGTGWTGVPDSCSGGDPDITSSNCTNSDVFRLNTKQFFSGDVRVTLRIKQNADIHSANCNADDSCWHGTHIWSRYQSQYDLYYASINRADGKVAIKRKVPCGPDNSGTYITLATATHDWAVGSWRQYSVNTVTNADGSVTIRVYDDTSGANPVITGTDTGGTNPNWSGGCNTPGHGSSASYLPITAAGAVGIRGDFANFNIDDFQVSNVASVAHTPTPAPTTPAQTPTPTKQAPAPTAPTTGTTPGTRPTDPASTTPTTESNETKPVSTKQSESLPAYSKSLSILSNHRSAALYISGILLLASLAAIAGMWLVRYEMHQRLIQRRSKRLRSKRRIAKT